MRRLLTPVFWPGEFHGLYSPWGQKESDTLRAIEKGKIKIELYLITRGKAKVCGKAAIGIVSLTSVF